MKLKYILILILTINTYQSFSQGAFVMSYRRSVNYFSKTTELMTNDKYSVNHFIMQFFKSNTEKGFYHFELFDPVYFFSNAGKNHTYESRLTGLCNSSYRRGEDIYIIKSQSSFIPIFRNEEDNFSIFTGLDLNFHFSGVATKQVVANGGYWSEFADVQPVKYGSPFNGSGSYNARYRTEFGFNLFAVLGNEDFAPVNFGLNYDFIFFGSGGHAITAQIHLLNSKKIPLYGGFAYTFSKYKAISADKYNADMQSPIWTASLPVKVNTIQMNVGFFIPIK